MGGKSSSEKEGKGSPPPSVNREERLRIALIGVRGVGKSNIIFRTLTGNFYEYAHDFPLEEIYGTNRIIDEKVVHVEFLDNRKYFIVFHVSLIDLALVVTENCMSAVHVRSGK